MKKKILILILCIYFTNIYSQNFYGGINIGTTISQVDGDNHGGYHKISPLGGVYVRNDFNDSWGMFMGLEYKKKGSKAVNKNDKGDIVSYYAINLDYIILNVMTL